jgi:hypothetical protein
MILLLTIVIVSFSIYILRRNASMATAVPAKAFKPAAIPPVPMQREAINPIQVSHIVATAAGDFPRRVINGYQVLEELGAGAYGRILKVENVLDKRQYALKKVNRVDALGISAIWTEMETIKDLKHPHIIRYRNAFEVRILDLVTGTLYLPCPHCISVTQTTVQSIS